jgi:BirA family biotin operon repressor/biotin-[acetyl-CoA-carboxylase] ligase
MDRLDAAAIVVPGVDVRVVERCSSTNDVLLKAISEKPVLLVAEEQTAGRGRRGRRWHSAPGAGVTFSLCRRVRRPVRELAALGVRAAGLKWPNDLVVDGAKLGGILVETRSQSAAAHAVIGIGINCRNTPGLERRIKRQIAFLDEFASVSRNRLIQETALALLKALEAFEAGGLDAVRADWEAMDAHAGQRLRVRLANGRVLTGMADGLAYDGSLRLMTRAGLQTVRSGRVVSARAA